jgi:hypothetical protein
MVFHLDSMILCILYVSLGFWSTTLFIGNSLISMDSFIVENQMVFVNIDKIGPVRFNENGSV